MMLVFVNGHWVAPAPVKPHRWSRDAGFVIVGDAAGAILLKREEVQELHSLLDRFIKELRSGDILPYEAPLDKKQSV